MKAPCVCLRGEVSIVTKYEFKVVPAPDQARKLSREEKGEDAVCVTLMETMNALGLEGWDFVRTEKLTMRQPSGIMGSKTIEREMLIFRREIRNFTTAAEKLEEERKAITARRVTRPELVSAERVAPRRINLTQAMDRATQATPAE